MDCEQLKLCVGIILNIMPSTLICGAHTITLQTETEDLCVHLTPQTYVVSCLQLRPGMRIAVFHRRDALPEEQHSAYPAYLISTLESTDHIVLEHFDQTLTASNHSLRLNISPQTDIQTANGQRFTCHPGNRTLLVYYTSVTKSDTPQCCPNKIIVY